MLQRSQSWQVPGRFKLSLFGLGSREQTMTKMTVITVTEAKGKIVQGGVFGAYAFHPLSKRGKSEHSICRGTDTLHRHARSSLGHYLPRGCVQDSRPPWASPARLRKVGRRPGQCLGLTRPQFSSQGTLTLSLLPTDMAALLQT